MFYCSKFLYALFLTSCLGINSLLGQAEKEIDHNKLPPLPLAGVDDAICRCVTTFTPSKAETFYLKIGKNFHVAPLIGEGISTDLPIKGVRKFSLYKKVIKEGEETHIPVVEAPLEGAGKSFLVILDQKKNKSIQAQVHNLSTTQFPANQIHFFNRSPAALGLQINTSKAVVAPFKSYNYPFENTNRNTYTSAKMVMRYKGETRVMASKRLRLVPGRRIFLICFPSAARVSLGATPLRVISHQDMP